MTNRSLLNAVDSPTVVCKNICIILTAVCVVFCSELHSLQRELTAAPDESSKQQEQYNSHTTMCSGLSTGTAYMGPQQQHLSHVGGAHNPLSRPLSRLGGAAGAGGEGLFTPTVTLRGGLKRADSTVESRPCVMQTFIIFFSAISGLVGPFHQQQASMHAVCTCDSAFKQYCMSLSLYRPAAARSEQDQRQSKLTRWSVS